MVPRLLLALLVLAALAGLGFWAQSALFEAEPAPVVAGPSQPSPDAPAPPSEQPPESPPVELSARVEVTTGNVLVFLPAQGRWLPIVAGQVLPADAVLRTKEGSVSLSIGDSIDVTVSRDSQFRLAELTSRLSRVKLEGGRVTAKVEHQEGAELLVQVLGSDAQARSQDGDFAVLRSNGAQVTVASTRGEVSLSAAGANVVVGQGQQSVVAPGTPPQAPQKILSEAFLELSRGQARKLNQRSTIVEGTTSPGSIVTVNGVTGETSQGSFSLRVPLKEGDNDLEVVALDVLGRKTVRHIKGLSVDSQPPELRGTVKW